MDTKLLLPSITDPAASVRNNAMRVLAAIARRQPGLIPVEPVAVALGYPTRGLTAPRVPTGDRRVAPSPPGHAWAPSLESNQVGSIRRAAAGPVTGQSTP